MMKSVALITIVCLLPAIVAVSVDNNNENKDDLHRIVEKTVPPSYKNAYNILMKANEIKTRSHNTNEGHDYPQIPPIPPIDPQVRLEVSEILAKTIEDINDRLYSLAENIKVLSQNQLLFNARLFAIEDANEMAIVPAVEAIHNHHQQTDQGSRHGDDRNGDDMEGNLSLINELVDVAVDRIEDAHYIVVAESGESHDESSQATSMPPHTSRNVNGDQQQQASTAQPHTSTNVNGDHQQQASASQPHTSTNVNGDQQQQASTMQPHTSTNVNGDQKQQASTMQPHTSTNVNGDHQQQASTSQPHTSTNVNGDHQQQASASQPHTSTNVNGDHQQQASTLQPHTSTSVKGDQKQDATTMPSHTSTNVNGDQHQQPTAMPPHANVVTTTAQSHANTEQETSAMPPQSNGDSQQSTTNHANGVEVLDEKRNYLGDHRRYSFRGYNPFISDRRSSVLSRLRDGLPLRQVSYQVPVKLRKGARLGQTWYPKEFQHRN
ncbi:uncharacterized protein LOC129256243 [Lytechinus pictus]|uniref:uncharacterized protein LOC129256243 n=1 Tax=Lytechinus pictus TaxID=7653 RepID=UPI0030B9C568